MNSRRRFKILTSSRENSVARCTSSSSSTIAIFHVRCEIFASDCESRSSSIRISSSSRWSDMLPPFESKTQIKFFFQYIASKLPRNTLERAKTQSCREDNETFWAIKRNDDRLPSLSQNRYSQKCRHRPVLPAVKVLPISDANPSHHSHHP